MEGIKTNRSHNKSFVALIGLILSVSLGYNVKQFNDLEIVQQRTVEEVKPLSIAPAPEVPVRVVQQQRPKGIKVAASNVSEQELNCMAKNIYYEAGNQSYVGKVAVGQVVLNRIKSPLFPKTVCGVVHQKTISREGREQCQFSWTCGPTKPIAKNSTEWRQSVKAASTLLAVGGRDVDILEGAMYFHARRSKPDWHKLKPVAHIDGHVFYKR